MTARTKPRLVTPQASVPKLRPVTEIDAAAHYPDSPSLQAKWIAAIKWLRRGSGPGWIMDRGSRAMFRSHEGSPQ